MELAAGSGLVNAVCFNLRFSPHNHNAAGMVRDGALGEPRYVTGAYHQDWLLAETDWNWRLVAERQGQLRAVADIGSHWLDLVSFVSGRRVVEVLADLHTFVPERNHPLEEVGTFAGHAVASDVERVRERMASDDAAGMLLRFEGGMRGLGQPGVGRLQEPDLGAERLGAVPGLGLGGPEYLWVGHRGRPNEVAGKDPALMTAWAPPSPATRPATSRATRTPSAGCSPPSTPTSPPAGRRPARLPDVRRQPRRRCSSATPWSSQPGRTWAPVRRSAP